jgi:hypothetical protein
MICRANDCIGRNRPVVSAHDKESWVAQEGMAPTTADTFPRLLLWHERVRPKHPALREKDLGIWQTWT